jgi:hypothetical protein
MRVTTVLPSPTRAPQLGGEGAGGSPVKAATSATAGTVAVAGMVLAGAHWPTTSPVSRNLTANPEQAAPAAPAARAALVLPGPPPLPPA